MTTELRTLNTSNIDEIEDFFLSVFAKEPWNDEFCIKSEEQGRGLGTQFLGAIETFLIKMGIHHIFLQTERTVPAYGFYKKNGFFELENHVSLVKQC